MALHPGRALVMNAGRDLDALIAENVMGLKPCTDPVGRCEAAHMTPCQCWGTGAGGSDLESYSETVAAAWQVLETLWRVGWWIKVSAQHCPDEAPGYQCRMDVSSESQGRPEYMIREELFGVVAHAETAPLAICRAALAAIGVVA